MNFYIEYNESAKTFFNWMKGDQYKVLSLNAERICGISDEVEFAKKTNEKINNLLMKNPNYHLGVIFNRELYSEPRKIDSYLGIWKQREIKEFSRIFIDKQERFLQYQFFYIFLGIAYFESIDSIDLFNIINITPYINVLFLSENDKYKIDDITPNMFFINNKTPKIDYYNLCNNFDSDKDIVIRFGRDSDSMEVDFIFKYI